MEAVGPEIEREQFIGLGGDVVGQQFDRGDDLQRGNHRRCRAKHAGGVAGGKFGGAGRRGEDAAQARGMGGLDGHHPTFRSDARAVDPGNTVLDRDVVQQIARGDVVGSVENEVNRTAGEKVFHPGERFNIARVGIDDVGIDGDAGVDRSQPFSGRGSFGPVRAGMIFIEQNLSLKVGKFDDVAIDQAKEAEARAHQLFGDLAAQCPAANQQYPRGGKPGLAGIADLGKEGLSVVSVHGEVFSRFDPCSAKGLAA